MTRVFLKPEDITEAMARRYINAVDGTDDSAFQGSGRIALVRRGLEAALCDQRKGERRGKERRSTDLDDKRGARFVLTREAQERAESAEPREIPVTEEQIEEGCRAFYASELTPPFGYAGHGADKFVWKACTAIYRAMRAKEPK